MPDHRQHRRAASKDSHRRRENKRTPSSSSSSYYDSSDSSSSGSGSSSTESSSQNGDHHDVFERRSINMLERFPSMFEYDNSGNNRRAHHGGDPPLVLKEVSVVGIQIWKMRPLVLKTASSSSSNNSRSSTSSSSSSSKKNIASWWFNNADVSFASVRLPYAHEQSLASVLLPKGYGSLSRALQDIVPIHLKVPPPSSSSASSSTKTEASSPSHLYLLSITGDHIHHIREGSDRHRQRETTSSSPPPNSSGEPRYFLVRWISEHVGWSRPFEWIHSRMERSSSRRRAFVEWAGAPRDAMSKRQYPPVLHFHDDADEGQQIELFQYQQQYHSSSSSSSSSYSQYSEGHQQYRLGRSTNSGIGGGYGGGAENGNSREALQHPNFEYELDPTEANWPTMKIEGQGSYGTVVSVEWPPFGNVVVKFTNTHEKMERIAPSDETIIHPIKRTRYTSIEVARGMELSEVNKYVASYYGWFSYGSTLGIVMQKLDRSLAQLLVSDGEGVTDALMLHIADGVTRGLHIMHSNSRVVHRDIKPENIMLDSEGNPYIIDVAFAVPLFTRSKVAGSRAFMSPYLFQSKEDKTYVNYDNGNADWFGWTKCLDMMHEYKPLPKSVMNVTNALAGRIADFPHEDASDIAHDLMVVINREIESEMERRTNPPLSGTIAADGRQYHHQYAYSSDDGDDVYHQESSAGNNNLRRRRTSTNNEGRLPSSSQHHHHHHQQQQRHRHDQKDHTNTSSRRHQQQQQQQHHQEKKRHDYHRHRPHQHEERRPRGDYARSPRTR